MWKLSTQFHSVFDGTFITINNIMSWLMFSFQVCNNQALSFMLASRAVSIYIFLFKENVKIFSCFKVIRHVQARASNFLILFVFAHHRVNILTNRIVIFYWPKSYYQMKALSGNFWKKFYFISASSMILFIEFMNGDLGESDDCRIGISQSLLNPVQIF